MGRQEETGNPHDFVLKQIENEINAGFAFVDVARRVLKVDNPTVQGNGSLNGAGRADSASAQVQTLSHRLSELREAVDLMLEMHSEARQQALRHS